VPDRGWLADLTAKWGESRINQGPTRLHGGGDPYERECWVWFPHDAINHNLAIDKHLDDPRWTVRATSCTSTAVLTLYRPDPPSDATVRQVLVLAGMLDA